MEALQVGPTTGITPFVPAIPQTAQPSAPSPTTEPSEAPTPDSAETPAGAPSPTSPPEPPTSEPVPTVTPQAPTTGPLPTLALPGLPALSNEERWRAQQEDREVFPELQGYRTSGSELFWYDPVNQQSLSLGVITGEFVAQARFILRGPGVEALEVPYQLNHSYGLTALSPAVIDRVRAAGYSDWIETYVVVTPNLSPR